MKKQEKKNLIFGIHPVKEALRSNLEIDRILVQKELKTRIFNEFEKDYNPDLQIPVQKVPKEAIDRICDENHQGVIAFISAIPYQFIEAVTMQIIESGKDPFILMLDHITDVKNFGAIVRSAESLGVDAIVIPSKGSAKINAESIKSSSGALLHIPICRYPNLIDATDLLKALGLRIISATEKGRIPVSEADLNGPLVLVMGSEEKGITKSILKRTDLQVFIPMKGKTASLNVSVATGILLYEINKQRVK